MTAYQLRSFEYQKFHVKVATSQVCQNQLGFAFSCQVRQSHAAVTKKEICIKYLVWDRAFVFCLNQLQSQICSSHHSDIFTLHYEPIMIGMILRLETKKIASSAFSSHNCSLLNFRLKK